MGLFSCSSFKIDDSTEEVIGHMKQVVATGPELSMDERNVLSVAYKNKAPTICWLWFVAILHGYGMIWYDLYVSGLWWTLALTWFDYAVAS